MGIDEATMLEELVDAPAERQDEVRLVYADWLDEQGQAEKAAILRAEHQMREAMAQLERLVPRAPDGWLESVFGERDLLLVSFPEAARVAVVDALCALRSLDAEKAEAMLTWLPVPVFRGIGPPLRRAEAQLAAAGAHIELRVAPPDDRWHVHLACERVLELVSYPSNQKISCIKVIRQYGELGLAEAKALSEALPAELPHRGRFTLAEARAGFEALGAVVRVRFRAMA
ncbi:MAG: ribosomal protein L7/L12 [Myxococcota bacterium]